MPDAMALAITGFFVVVVLPLSELIVFSWNQEELETSFTSDLQILTTYPIPLFLHQFALSTGSAW